MERSKQTQLIEGQPQANGSSPPQQQIHVVGPDLQVKGSYETTKRRGVDEDFVIKCKVRDVRGHGCVLKGRIALFERELKVLKAAERYQHRASAPTIGERSRFSQDIEDWDLSDVTLVENDGQGQAAHRIEANGCAVIFHSKKCATIEGISHLIFEQIVEWAYTGSFRAASEDVCDLLRAAAFFRIDRMKTKCEEYLRNKITERNCLELCQLAELHTEPSGELHEAVLRFIADNFETLSVADNFMQFDCVASLEKLLADDNLNVANEAEVFKFLVKWTNHDRASRETHFDSLFRCVRLYHLFPRFFHDFVCGCDLITGSEKGRVEAVKMDLFKFLCSRSSGSNNASLGSMLGVHVDTPRIPPRKTIICVGGSGTNPKNRLASIEIFDPARGEWRLATGSKQLCSGRSEMGAVCVGAKLFVVGGQDQDGNYLSTVEFLDLVTGEWSSLAPLRTARSEHALVALDGKWIYAIGGWRNGFFLKSVERYDIARNEWTEMAPMNVSRDAVAAAVYRGQIYVVGGFYNGSSLNSCERFDPIANSWTRIAPMLQKRNSCGVAVVGDYLYAIGGWVTGVDCVRYSFAKDKWTEIKPLQTPRKQLCVAVVGSRIYAIGGRDDNDKVLNTVEVYDTLTGKWTPSAPLNKPRHVFL